ncbi:hypothetical protein BJ742DRAFT_800145 [Cladochytrium replicatum]|nr:hypothetical protein BJ742DRAFT_800145 [Cladochytrium replicatum]
MPISCVNTVRHKPGINISSLKSIPLWYKFLSSHCAITVMSDIEHTDGATGASYLSVDGAEGASNKGGSESATPIARSRANSIAALYDHELHSVLANDGYTEDVTLIKLEELLSILQSLCKEHDDDGETLADLAVERIKLSMPFIRDDHDMEVICTEFVNSTEDVDYVRKQLLTYDLTDEGTAYIVLWMLFYLCKAYTNILRKIFDSEFTDILFSIVKSQSDAKHSRVALKLVLELLLIEEMSLADLEQLDASLVPFLFDQVEGRNLDEDEEYNYDLIRLIVVLSSQYEKKNVGRTIIHNRVLAEISERLDRCKTFTENLLFIFNRADERPIKRCVVQFLTSIFTTLRTANVFYSNDLVIVVDVVVREMERIDDDDVAMQQAYLGILPPLLANTSLSLSRNSFASTPSPTSLPGTPVSISSQHTPTSLTAVELPAGKKRELVRMLRRLAADASGAVTFQTKKLAERILDMCI